MRRCGMEEAERGRCWICLPRRLLRELLTGQCEPSCSGLAPPIGEISGPAEQHEVEAHTQTPRAHSATLRSRQSLR